MSKFRNKLLVQNLSVPKQIVYDQHSITIEPVDNNIVQVQLICKGSKPNLQYSYDNLTWNSIGTQKLSISKSGTYKYVLLRGDNPSGFTRNTSYPAGIAITGGGAKVSGNIMALISYTSELLTIPNSYCFFSLFNGEANGYTGSIVDASDLNIPAVNLKDNCYQSMFQRCEQMLYSPTILPATSLRFCCYGYMFNCCSSLITTPILPATILAQNCYQTMFNRCYALKIAPELPATTLVSNCYYQLFRFTGVNQIKCLATSITGTSNWFESVSSSTGTFIKHPDANWSRGISGIPNGWTIENAIL